MAPPNVRGERLMPKITGIQLQRSLVYPIIYVGVGMGILKPILTSTVAVFNAKLRRRKLRIPSKHQSVNCGVLHHDQAIPTPGTTLVQAKSIIDLTVDSDADDADDEGSNSEAESADGEGEVCSDLLR